MQYVVRHTMKCDPTVYMYSWAPFTGSFVFALSLSNRTGQLFWIQLHLSFSNLLNIALIFNIFWHPTDGTQLNFLIQFLPPQKKENIIKILRVLNLLRADDTIIALIFLSLMKSALPRTDGTLLTLISQLSLHEQLIKHNLLCICLSAPEAQKAF